MGEGARRRTEFRAPPPHARAIPTTPYQRAAAIRPREEDTTMLTLLRNTDPGFAALSAEVSRLMNDITQPGARGYGLAPSADIVETEAGFQVVLDLPGLDPAAIKLDIENDTLTVQADRKQPALADGANLHRSERRFGTSSGRSRSRRRWTARASRHATTPASWPSRCRSATRRSRGPSRSR
ncbi:hypothetical protein A2cp1_0840 [Anaeromyxobacter dehalogenans 2CP-1]|uniref:SHSP domain-containing protein n=1 Tax=Anaeromyxobacter dehalogenans (strain ATCC BAA-258 / DSM 21875 / 2CP-1) TaxID=455488 RepID=B8JDU7_ANAD2|nr:hypothetical protein A2cp1_0840 [Anaeromyxobacter dehalogenans 2CP-1]